ncbi:MAG: indole-3-glycerol phosphate synthase [Alphaproteobacteria bacterium]|jgi:indole-3-glycerol phosphate synthase
MSNVLERICTDKRAVVEQCKARRPIDVLSADAEKSSPPRGFAKALKLASITGYGLISEIKRASPSKGLIREDFNPATLAQAYQEGGATCLSVLTETPNFEGKDAHLIAARSAVDLPVLRKDFMIDPYQIVESRSLGADCILLIMAALSDDQASEMESIAQGFGMDVLIEVHDEAELERALRLSSPLIGVNNRNLKTLETNLDTTHRLAPLVPDDRILVCESGLYTPQDLAEMAGIGARCFLIGESLMRQEDVAQAVRNLLADPAPPSPLAERAAS